MSYVASPEEQVRKLRAVRAAVASALDNGIPHEQVMRAVESGVAWDQETRDIRAGKYHPPIPVQVDTSPTGALADLERAVGLRR